MMMNHHLGGVCAAAFFEIFWRLLGEWWGPVTVFGALVKPKKKNKNDQKRRTRTIKK